MLVISPKRPFPPDPRIGTNSLQKGISADYTDYADFGFVVHDAWRLKHCNTEAAIQESLGGPHAVSST